MTQAGDSVEASSPLSAWGLAVLAAAVFAIAPATIGGIRLRAPAGPVRDAWVGLVCDWLDGQPLHRMPAAISDARLLGGLDLAATLAAGRPVAETGLLAQADGGILIAAMAERMSPGTAARLAMVLDTGQVGVERDGATLVQASRFGLIAFDEGIADDEQPPVALTDRLAISLDLTTLSHRDIDPPLFEMDEVVQARLLFPSVTIDEAAIEALCAACLALGIDSARAPLLAVKVACAVAALMGHDRVMPDDMALAAALVLAPRATRMPAGQPQTGDRPEADTPEQTQDQTSPPDSPDEQDSSRSPQPDLDERVLDAAKAAIPAGLLADLLAAGGRMKARNAGRAGLYQKAPQRGRVVGSKAGDWRGGTRLDVVETLRTAAPWQVLRRREAAAAGALSRSGILVRREDVRVARYRQRSETATLFVVDASGSAALQRLAEAKGAVRLLLADCYIRRDEVALIAFRKTQAELVLPPTRSLVRAERALAAMPGGGGTPLATAIDVALSVADGIRRKGRTPAIVFMTDGRANIGRDGQSGRAKAQDEARLAARTLRSQGFSALLIDTSPQPHAQAAELATEMGARYVPLPHADAGSVSHAVASVLASH